MEVDIIVTIGIAAVILFVIAHTSRIIRSGAMHKTLRKAVALCSTGTTVSHRRAAR